MPTKTLFLVPLALGLAGAAAAQQDLSALQQQLLARDAQIRSLLQRVEALEQRIGGASSARESSPPVPSPSLAPGPVASDPSTQPVGSVAEDEPARALERALVREGGFVLPPGAVELEPRYTYSYSARRGLDIVATPAGPQVADRDSSQQRHEAALGLRMGLPRAFQVEIRAPYVLRRTDSVAPAVGLDDSRQVHGAGDVQLLLTKQLSTDRGTLPALLGSLAWQHPTGDYRIGALSPGQGFPSATAGLTAVKRQDPLVFIGGVSYTAFSARDHDAIRVKPGDALGYRLAALLAASPETSLRAGLDVSRSRKTRANGVEAAGSDALSGVLELGLSTLLSKDALLDLNVGFGITPDAPDMRIGVSLPIRFR